MTAPAEIVFLSSSPTKIGEAREILQRAGLAIEVRPSTLELPEIQSESQQEIALEKARAAHAQLGRPVLADDTGLFFARYANFPGTMTRIVETSLGLEGIFRLFDEGDAGFFRTTLCLLDGERRHRFFEGRLDGTLTKAARLTSPFRFDQIFIPAGSRQTLSRFSTAERSLVSHRKLAFDQLVRGLTDHARI